MKTILIATEKPFAKIAVQGIEKIIKEAGHELVLLENYAEREQLKAAITSANAVIVRSDKIDKEIIDTAANLEIIVRAGAGYDNVDTEAATAKNIVVMNTPGQNSNAVGELALGLMLFAARNHFDGSSGSELKGKTLGLYALGNTSKALAKLARGFEMDIYTYAPSKGDALLAEQKISRAASPEELFAKCQYISLHIPLKAETKGCITYELMSKMPGGATLINTARKEVIDETGLVKMFANRPDFKYMSDIPPSNKDAVDLHCGNRMYCTPKKMGAQTAEANINAGLAAAEQIVNFFKSGDITYQVN